MANFTNLKQTITNVIKSNNNRQITGQQTQDAFINTITEIAKGSVFAGIATPSTNPGSPDGNVFYLATQQGLYTYFGSYLLTQTGLVLFDNRSGAWSATLLNAGSAGINTSGLKDDQVFLWDSSNGALKEFLLKELSAVPLTTYPDGLYLVPNKGIYLLKGGVLTLIAASPSPEKAINECFIINTKRGCFNINTTTTPPRIELTATVMIVDGQNHTLVISAANIPFEYVSNSTGLYFMVAGVDNGNEVMKCWSLDKNAASINSLTNPVCFGMFYWSLNTSVIPNVLQVQGLSIKNHDILINGQYVFGNGSGPGFIDPSANLFDNNNIFGYHYQINRTTGSVDSTGTNRSVSNVMSPVIAGEKYVLTGTTSTADFGFRFLDAGNNPLKPVLTTGQHSLFEIPSLSIAQSGFWAPTGAVAAQFDWVSGMSGDLDTSTLGFYKIS